MRRSLLFVLLLSMVGLAGAQWLEKVIPVPNSEIELSEFSHVFYNPVNNHVYVGGGACSGVQVLDATTRSRRHGIDSADWCIDVVLCLNRDRIYVTGEDKLVVVDPENDSTLKVLPLPGYYTHGAYNQVMHKAYVACEAEPVLCVFDVGPDTVLRRIDLVDGAGRIVWDSASNRVFLRPEDSTEYGITVIDCSADTVVGHMPTAGAHRGDMVLDPAGRQLYVHGQESGTHLDEIWVYDVDSLKVRDTIAVPGVPYWEGTFCFNPQARLLYLAHFYREPRDAEDTLILIDCATNTISKHIGLPDWVSCIAFDEQNGKLYVGQDFALAVLAVPDSVTALVPVPDDPLGVGCGPLNGDVYAPAEGAVNLVSGEGDTVIARLDCPTMVVRSMVWTAAENRLYAPGYGGITIIGPENTVVKQIEPGSVPWGSGTPAYSEELNRLYVATYNGITRFDCNSDSLTYAPTPRRPGSPPFLVPGHHKLYVPAEDSLTVVYDIYSDSVVRILGDLQPQFLYNPRNGLVYGFHVKNIWQYPDPRESLRVIDPRRDTLVAVLDWGHWTRTVLNTTDNALYCAVDRAEPCHLLVCDAAANAVVDTIEVPGQVLDLAWHEPLDKLYAIGDSVAFVIDCRTRTLTGTIGLRSHSGWIPSALVNERNDKLWICSGAGVDVIQCSKDSVVASFDVRSDHGSAWNVLDNRVYTSNGEQVFVFGDDPAGIEADASMPLAHLGLEVTSNPARGAVSFICAMPGLQPGRLVVFDMLGRAVWGHAVQAGVRTSLTWQRTDERGRTLPEGVYFARLESGGDNVTAKVVLK